MDRLLMVAFAVAAILGHSVAFRPVDCTGTRNVIDKTLLQRYFTLFNGVDDTASRTLRETLEFDTLLFLAGARCVCGYIGCARPVRLLRVTCPRVVTAPP